MFWHVDQQNISRIIERKAIELGWLTAITEWSTPKTVFHNPHSHQHLELIFCMKGSLVYEVDGYGTLTMGSGTGMIIPPDTMHVLKGEMDSPGERIGFHIANPPFRRRRYAVFSPSVLSSFYETMLKSAAHPFHLNTMLVGSVKELVRLVRQANTSSAELGLLRSLCCTILYHMVDMLKNPSLAPKQHLMDEAVRFLETNHGRKINANDLVRHMGYGRTQLYELFKKHTGLSPNEYLVRFRIDRARQLLSKKDQPLNDIAKAVGFSTTRYFRQVFLKYTGLEP